MTRQPSKALGRYCEARTRRSTLCKRPAGWGTDHLGRGRCKLHGGSSPSHERKASREEAYEFVVGHLGYHHEIDPLDGALLAVHIAAGAVLYWERQLAVVAEADEQPSPRMVEGYRLAAADLSRMSDVASKAGIDERLVNITERMAEQITLAFEDAANAMNLDPAQRAKGVAAFAAALAALERAREPALIEQ